jgi:hypothetical protein
MNTVAKSPVPKTRKRTTKVVSTYRGIRLPDMSAGSQFTREEVEKAIEAAIAQCPEVFAARKT